MHNYFNPSRNEAQRSVMVKWNFNVLLGSSVYSKLITLPHPMNTAIWLPRLQCEVQILDESLSFLFSNRLSIFLSYTSFFRNKPVCLETTFLLPIDVHVLRSKLKISFTFFCQSFIIFMTQCTLLRLNKWVTWDTRKVCLSIVEKCWYESWILLE